MLFEHLSQILLQIMLLALIIKKNFSTSCSVLIWFEWLFWNFQHQNKMRNPAPNIWAQSVLALSQEKWNTITHHGRGTSRSTVCLIQLLFFAWYWQLWLCFWILNFCMPWRLAIAMPKELWQVSCCRYPVLCMLWQLLYWITFTTSWQHFWLSRVSEAPKRNKKKLRLLIRM